MPDSRPKLLAVVAQDNTRASLEALRDYLAAALDDELMPRDRSSLARRLESVLVRIDELNKGVPSDPDNLFGAPPAVEPAAPGADS